MRGDATAGTECPHCGHDCTGLARGAICPGCLRPRRPPKMKRPFVRYSTPKLQAAPSKPKRVEFQAPTPAYQQECARCHGDAQTWHHWIRQEWLRVHVERLRLEEAAARKLLRRLLRDLRNLTPFCRACHAAGEAKDIRSRHSFKRHEIPPSAWAFAREVGGEPFVARLERAYPTK